MKLRNTLSKYWYGAGAFVSSSAFAALPTISDANVNKGDYIAMGESTADSTIALGVKVVGASMLIGVAWIAVTTLMEVNAGQKKWADVGKNLIAGVGLLALGFILLTQADSII